MKDSLYNKYFKKRNESLETLDQKFNSKRVYETFNSALKFFRGDFPVAIFIKFCEKIFGF